MKHELRNSLTDISSGYKQVNHIIMFCISGLGKYCPLVQYIFSKIIYNKFYGNGAKYKGEFEEKRIYNSTPMTVNSILMDLNPYKYNCENKSIVNDRSNLKRKLNFLHDNNILYLWSYSGKYIFFFERDFGAWKVYNPKGVVIPKTIYKVANIGLGAIDSMVASDDKDYGKSDRRKIEMSFMSFVDNLIKKMEPSVAKKFHVLTNKDTVKLYLEDVKMIADELCDIDEYDGLVEDETFQDRLPFTVKESLVMRKKIEKPIVDDSNFKKESDLDSLIPVTKNLCKNKALEKRTRKKRTNKNIIMDRSSIAEVGNFQSSKKIDPFKDARSFTVYYHNYLNAFSGGACLESVKVDVAEAGKILDKLSEFGKKGDMFFLKAWVEDFCKELRKKDRTKNKKHTSLSAFYKTLPKFKESFLDPR